jgi:tRNA uridine 5-carboxymethylaminomethyl modification enzyme
MNLLKNRYDVIVIGLGHAGCEAVLAAARLGASVLGVVLDKGHIARMSCNPSIGGPGKAQLVRELDALGGEMGLAADETYMHIRMLNAGKGPAVRAIRAQIDKPSYAYRMIGALTRQRGLEIAEGEVESIIIEAGRVKGAIIAGERVFASAVILASGTYLGGRTYVGDDTKESGPDGSPASHLTPSLIEAGIRLMRFKTGTSPRIVANSINYGEMETQGGEDLLHGFSHLKRPNPRKQANCWITYTNEETHGIIRENIDRAPIFSGLIKGIGPRYCPSIEAKIVRFAGKSRHQLFVEPQQASGEEMYVAGLSTSLPRDVQERMLSTISGLRRAKISKYGYAIEYDCIDPSQLKHTLEHRNIQGFYSAGQSNGSSGYEEAAAQGLVAGANAALWGKGRPPLLLGRDQSYIGVLIDDLVMKGTDEPYRMMTARAEFRLELRQDNADFRLTPFAIECGLASEARIDSFEKKACIKAGITNGNTEIAATSEQEAWYIACVEENVKLDKIYDGYIEKEKKMATSFRKMENRLLPANINFSSMYRLSNEAREKFSRMRPESIGEASRIPGISPSDIAALIIHLRKEGQDNGNTV